MSTIIRKMSQDQNTKNRIYFFFGVGRSVTKADCTSMYLMNLKEWRV